MNLVECVVLAFITGRPLAKNCIIHTSTSLTADIYSQPIQIYVFQLLGLNGKYMSAIIELLQVFISHMYIPSSILFPIQQVFLALVFPFI